MKIVIERCKHWNGKSSPCDLERLCCQKRVGRLESKGVMSCYEKPFSLVSDEMKYNPQELFEFITDIDLPEKINDFFPPKRKIEDEDLI